MYVFLIQVNKVLQNTAFWWLKNEIKGMGQATAHAQGQIQQVRVFAFKNNTIFYK